MTDLREQIAQAVEATTILSASHYAWFGVASQRLPASALRILNRETLRRYLQGELQSRLYSQL